MNFRPVISLCHTTARLPDGWLPAARAWHERADNPDQIEHVLVVDQERAEEFQSSGIASPFADWKIVVNRDRRCAVDGWNTAARHSRGDLLITLADDWFPCEHWDTELLKRIPDLRGKHVVRVATGGDDEILTFSIITRAYLDHLTLTPLYDYRGGFFYHEYLGMYADSEFTDIVTLIDNVKTPGTLIQATELLFQHDHPHYTGRPMDDVHKWQHRDEAFEVGEAIYERRRHHLGLGPSLLTKFKRPLVGVCVRGNPFEGVWVANWSMLFAHLMKHYRVLPIFGQSSNPYACRQDLLNQIVNIYPRVHYLLWIDGDNVVTPWHFEHLIADLKNRPELDGVSGWCWTHGVISCGRLSHDAKFQPMNYDELFAGGEDIKPITGGGFPCFLWRGDLIDKLEKFPFLPILGGQYQYGMSGEDTAFFYRSGLAGAKFAVDRRVKIPHLKLQPEEYDVTSQSSKEGVA